LLGGKMKTRLKYIFAAICAVMVIGVGCGGGSSSIGCSINEDSAVTTLAGFYKTCGHADGTGSAAGFF
jgi:hypothetical protein